MSRSGYTDEDEEGTVGLYRANIDRAIKGKRGQKFFRELVIALDALPNKRLTSGELEADGEVCALGALGRFKGTDLEPFDDGYDNWDGLGKAFDVAPMLTQEVMYENDNEFGYHGAETPEQRWTRVRAWTAKQLKDAP